MYPVSSVKEHNRKAQHLPTCRKVHNGLMDLIQIWHVVVTSFQGVPYFKVTLNSHALKRYIYNWP